MPNQKALPAVIRMRAERILKKSAKAAYRVEDNKANLLKVILQDGSIHYVDLSENREVKEKEVMTAMTYDLDVPSGKVTERDVMITRASVEGEKPAPKKKKTVTKKKSTKK
jgi:hypothetical protein